MFPGNSWNYLHARLVTWSQTRKAKTVTCRMSRKDDYGSEWEGRDTSEGNSKFLNVFFPGSCYAIWFLTENSEIFRKMVLRITSGPMMNASWSCTTVRLTCSQCENQSDEIQMPLSLLVEMKVTAIVSVWNRQAEVPFMHWSVWSTWLANCIELAIFIQFSPQIADIHEYKLKG